MFVKSSQSLEVELGQPAINSKMPQNVKKHQFKRFYGLTMWLHIAKIKIKWAKSILGVGAWQINKHNM